MRGLLRITSAMLILLTIGGASARAEEDNSEARSHVTGDSVLQWCFHRFPFPWPFDPTVARPPPKQARAPFKLEDLIAPAHLVTKTEIVGRPPGYIRKYRGAWIWPAVDEPPDVVLFVERLSDKEMAIALVFRATEKNRDYRERLQKNSREKLTWNGTAFSSGPEGELESTTTIYISAFSDALLLVRTNKREAWPMCLISSKHY